MLTEMELNFKDAFGDTLSKYAKVALALNQFPENVTLSVKNVADAADVHWNTAKKALFFFELIFPMIPVFKRQEGSKFKIIKKPSAVSALNNLFLSNEMKITTKLLLNKVTSKSMKLRKYQLIELLESHESEKLSHLLEKGLLNIEDGGFYLSRKGILLGNIGIKKLIDLGIKLPWEEEKEKTIAVRKPIRKETHLLNLKPTYWEPGIFITSKREPQFYCSNKQIIIER